MLMEERQEGLGCPGDTCGACRVGHRYLESVPVTGLNKGEPSKGLPFLCIRVPRSGPGCPENLHSSASFFTLVWTPKQVVILHSTLPLSKSTQVVGQGHRIMGSEVLLAEDGGSMGNWLIL